MAIKCELTITGYFNRLMLVLLTELFHYSPICLTSTDKVTIYSKVNTSITISNITIKKTMIGKTNACIIGYTSHKW